MHIAISFDVPVVAIFGPTLPKFGFAPYSIHRSEIIEKKEIACRPCSIHGKKTCPYKHFRCMMEIKPREVFLSVLSLLKKQLD
jgi:heptosyltransferase-2